MAGAILYGLMRRIRSSRQLEHACGHHVDFIWLVEGRSIDHDTFCKFRTRFKEPLKKLFREINRLAMQVGLIELVEVAFDGTRVKANARKFQMWTATKVETMLAELESQAASMLDEAETGDALANNEQAKPLPPELADPARRREKLRAALERLRIWKVWNRGKSSSSRRSSRRCLGLAILRFATIRACLSPRVIG
jgi:hypothetical protein